jgi:hypothetical protein
MTPNIAKRIRDVMVQAMKISFVDAGMLAPSARRCQRCSDGEAAEELAV